MTPRDKAMLALVAAYLVAGTFVTTKLLEAAFHALRGDAAVIVDSFRGAADPLAHAAASAIRRT